MQHWTPREQKAARQLGLPPNPDLRWWWRARHVVNSDEHARLQDFATWLRREYAPSLEALARRSKLRIV